MEKDWQHCNSETFWREVAPHSHVVQLYEREEALLSLLEDFVAGGVSVGDVVILIATGEHLAAMEERLADHGLDVGSLCASSQYLPLEAQHLMARFMVDGCPDERLFAEAVTGLFDRVCTGGRPVRAFGEMVALLWAGGNSGAIVQLDHLWNAISEREGLALFCAFPQEAFCGEDGCVLSALSRTESRMITNAGEQRFDLAYRDIYGA